MPIDGLNMKATATIVEIRGTFTGTITCADGTYIEVLNNTPALTQEAAIAAVRRMAQLIDVQLTSIAKARTPSTESGRPCAYADTSADLHEQAERETRHQIEQIRRKVSNRKTFDKWIKRNLANDNGRPEHGKAGAA